MFFLPCGNPPRPFFPPFGAVVRSSRAPGHPGTDLILLVCPVDKSTVFWVVFPVRTPKESCLSHWPSSLVVSFPPRQSGIHKLCFLAFLLLGGKPPFLATGTLRLRTAPLFSCLKLFRRSPYLWTTRYISFFPPSALLSFPYLFSSSFLCCFFS